MNKRYNTLSDFLRGYFGRRVYKVSLWGGFTCPNRDGRKGEGGCIYCQPQALRPLSLVNGESIEEQLKDGIAYIKKRHKAEGFIAYLQSYSNTYAPIERLRETYYRAIDHPEVVGLAVSTRPDVVDDRVLDILSEIARERFLWVEYGLQSANDKTLESLNRGHTVKDFLSTYERTVKRGIRVCVHVILGLPEEDRKDMLKTAKLLSELKVWGVKIHHLQVYKGTRLEELYKDGRIRLLTLEDYIPLVVNFIELLNPSTVIHRLIGDAPKGFLVAPNWGNKLSIIRMIEGYMEEKDTYQGAKAKKEVEDGRDGEGS